MIGRNRRKNGSMQIVVLVVLILVVAVSFAIYAQKIAKTHIARDTNHLVEITSRDADAFSIYFSSKIDFTKSLGQSLSNTPMDSWSHILQAAGEIEESSLFVIDGNGNDVLNGENIGVSEEMLNQNLASDENGLLGPGYDPITGTRATFAYSKFQNTDGLELYVLMSLDNESLYEKMNLSVYGENGYSYIADSQGYTVLYSKQPNSNKTFSSVLELLTERKTSYMHSINKISELEKALKYQKAGVGYYRHDGKDCVVSVAPIQISGDWNVITVVDEQYVYSEINHMLLHTLQVLIVMVVCMTIISAMIWKTGKRSRQYQMLNEQLQIAKNEADSANQAKSEFLSRMSHDIRTPMNTIMNLTSLVKEEIDDPQAAISDLEKVETANTFLLALINDILDMSRIEQGELELHPEVYSYSEFIHYIFNAFDPLCKAKHIRFVLNGEDDKIDVYVDKVRFNQICSNLLANAVKYTPAGGTVSFRFEHGEIENGKIPCTFLISDTGIGMSETFQTRMFDPFERESTSMEAVQGSGLGLSIVKEIVALMGGTIDVESNPGSGTTFCVRLNLEVAKEQEQIEEDKIFDLSVLDGRHVLVVEDHPMNRQIAQRLLNKVGISVSLANNGKEAVEDFKMCGMNYDAILMDMRMPVMDGISATKTIRNLTDHWAKKIPIIAMTANAFQEDKDAAAEAGMTAYLSKPINPQELYQELAHYIMN